MKAFQLLVLSAPGNMLSLPFDSLSSATLCTQAIFFFFAASSCLLYLVLHEILTPVHVRFLPLRSKWHLPIGPPGLPIIGNLHKWRSALRSPVTLLPYLISLAKYGEMTTVTLGSKTWVLLNTPRVVNEIIAKRGSITHQRPPMPIASDLISQGKRSVLRPTADWVEGRRVMNHLLNGSPLKTYGEWQELESVQMLASYLFQPERWYAHHYRYANSVMHRIVLGERLEKNTAELENLQRVTVEFLRNINASVVDFYPQLASLPEFLQFWRRGWGKVGQDHYRTFMSWWGPVKKACEEGIAPPSFVRDALLAKETRYTDSDEEAMYLAMSMISAGSDNTRMPLNTLVMAALCYPDAMTKAREEADAVCGGMAGRLPGVGDIPKMPYTCALVKEVLRWRPAVPLVPQHQLTQDLEFEGYCFPAGTEFLINSFPVAHDIDGSNAFWPERWMDGNEANITHGLWVFGGGRRICVGYKVAQTQLFVAFARLLYCFEYAPVSTTHPRSQRGADKDRPASTTAYSLGIPVQESHFR